MVDFVDIAPLEADGGVDVVVLFVEPVEGTDDDVEGVLVEELLDGGSVLVGVA